MLVEVVLLWSIETDADESMAGWDAMLCADLLIHNHVF